MLGVVSMGRTTLTLYFDVLKNELGRMGRRVQGECLVRDVGTGDMGLGRFPGQGWSLTLCPFSSVARVGERAS